MALKSSPWTFYAQVLSRALNELESACTAAPESPEYKFYRSEAPVVQEEAREALAALKHHVRDLELAQPKSTANPTHH